jgi:hypothetical protein
MDEKTDCRGGQAGFSLLIKLRAIYRESRLSRVMALDFHHEVTANGICFLMCRFDDAALRGFGSSFRFYDAASVAVDHSASS